MREFKYKGATVRPYEPFNAHQTDGFSVGSLRGVCPTLRANKHDLIIIIEDEETTNSI